MFSSLWIIVYLFSLVSCDERRCLDCIFKIGTHDLSEILSHDIETNLTGSWKQLGQPYESLDLCLASFDCYRNLLTSYLTDHGQDCNKDGTVDCNDYFLLLKHGSNCQSMANQQTKSISQVINDCYKQYWIDNVSDDLSEVTTITQPGLPTTTDHDFWRSPTPSADSVDDSDDNVNSTVIPRATVNLIGKECFRCICQASSNCQINETCSNQSPCGPYQLSKDYYELAGSPGASYEECAQDTNCSENAVQSYVTKYLRDCDGNQLIDCDDFAAIHKFGPKCSDPSNRLTDYWRHFEYCFVMADNVRREHDPWENSPVPSTNQLSVSFPPLIPYPVKFSTKAPIKPDRLFNQIIQVDEHCLSCICQASSGCNLTRGRCTDGTNCGPYAIDLAYMKDSGKDLRYVDDQFDDCANDKDCSESIVRNYIEKNAVDCNQDEILDCADFAMVHRIGRTKCVQTKEIDNFMDSAYWAEFQFCYGFD